MRNPDARSTLCRGAARGRPNGDSALSIIWTIVIGFVAGVVAKFIMPGPNEPSGFILTTLLGIIGAFVATWLGQSIGWYGMAARRSFPRRPRSTVASTC